MLADRQTDRLITIPHSLLVQSNNILYEQNDLSAFNDQSAERMWNLYKPHTSPKMLKFTENSGFHRTLHFLEKSQFSGKMLQLWYLEFGWSLFIPEAVYHLLTCSMCIWLSLILAWLYFVMSLLLLYSNCCVILKTNFFAFSRYLSSNFIPMSTRAHFAAT